MASTAEQIEPAITHLEIIRARMIGEPSVGAVAAAIAEAMEIIQSREGITSNFAFNLGLIPVRTRQASYTAPQVIDAIDSYISFNKANLPKKTDAHLPSPPVTKPFIHPERIDKLKLIRSEKYDLTRLIRYCEEMNTCYASGCWLAVAMLSRAIIDHVPPAFGYSDFKDVANHYKGAASFKEAMKSLDTLYRKISDTHLHMQLRQKESLPTSTQIDCSAALDVLIGEIIRIMS